MAKPPPTKDTSPKNLPGSKKKFAGQIPLPSEEDICELAKRFADAILKDELSVIQEREMCEKLKKKKEEKEKKEREDKERKEKKNRRKKRRRRMLKMPSRNPNAGPRRCEGEEESRQGRRLPTRGRLISDPHVSRTPAAAFTR
ncbi:hypothetical protein BDZ89DRAFT_1141005 [Hymenopellis radicata]|nr:hypothetical protein BDZ89DRAFT_1141005 [Hymenopellis radicata]